jgi:hypothetical protein
MNSQQCAEDTFKQCHGCGFVYDTAFTTNYKYCTISECESFDEEEKNDSHVHYFIDSHGKQKFHYHEFNRRTEEFENYGFRRCRVHSSGHLVCSDACASECQCEETYTSDQLKRAEELEYIHLPTCHCQECVNEREMKEIEELKKSELTEKNNQDSVY